MRLLPALALSAIFALPAWARPDAAAVPVSASGAVAREIAAVRDAERKRLQAVINRDIEALRNLISGEYYHVESNGRVRTKTEYLQALGRGEFRVSSYEIDDVEIKLLAGGRAAVVTGRFHAQVLGLNATRQLRGRYVRIWAQQAEGWRNTLHQSTEIRPAAAQTADAR
jgi:hypothetical protein